MFSSLSLLLLPSCHSVPMAFEKENLAIQCGCSWLFIEPLTFSQSCEVYAAFTNSVPTFLFMWMEVL